MIRTVSGQYDLTGRPVPDKQPQFVDSASLHYSLSPLGGVLYCRTISLSVLTENLVVAHDKIAHIYVENQKSFNDVNIDILD
jgi:hypothetical protein